MESDTIGGLLIESLGHMPARNEHVDIGNHRFIAISLNPSNKKLIDRVSIIPIPKHDDKKAKGGQP
jgi:Mg2+/Co2+ transporter CorC